MFWPAADQQPRAEKKYIDLLQAAVIAKFALLVTELSCDGSKCEKFTSKKEQKILSLFLLSPGAAGSKTMTV